jgi:hypothetical protein
MRLIIFVPLFLAFTAGIIYLFYSFGKICSVHISEHAGLIHNIISPFKAAEYAPNQLAFSALALIGFALIFASSAIKAFGRSTTNLLFLAFCSYLAGLFTPEVPFMQLSMVKQFLLTPEYCLCYFVIAFVWVLAFCWKLNRTFPQGLLGVALMCLSMTTVYLAAHLSIPPNPESVLTKVLLLSALFCSLLVAYYLLSPKEKETMLLPTILFLLGCVSLWTYSVSGLSSNINTTLNALISKIEINTHHSDKQNMNISSSMSTFSQLNKTNDITPLTNEEAIEFLEPKVDKIAPNIFDDSTKPFFLNMLVRYYKVGPSKMKVGVWDYVLSYPIKNFNNHAKNNNAYFFLILMLSALGTLGCAGHIIFGDDL